MDKRSQTRCSCCLQTKKVFNQRSSTGSSVSFLSEWFERSFKAASQCSTQDSNSQLADPESPKLAGIFVGAGDPMIQSTEQVKPSTTCKPTHSPPPIVPFHHAQTYTFASQRLTFLYLKLYPSTTINPTIHRPDLPCNPKPTLSYPSLTPTLPITTLTLPLHNPKPTLLLAEVLKARPPPAQSLPLLQPQKPPPSFHSTTLRYPKAYPQIWTNKTCPAQPYIKV